MSPKLQTCHNYARAGAWQADVDLDEEAEFKDSSPEASPRHGGSARVHVRPFTHTFSLGSGTFLPISCDADCL